MTQLKRSTKKKARLNTKTTLFVLCLIFILSALYMNSVVSGIANESNKLNSSLSDLASVENDNTSDSNHGNNNGIGKAKRQKANIEDKVQSSFWVDQEKKLKNELKKLEKIQSKGELLNVPIAHDYLGNDVTHWKTYEKWEDKVNYRTKLLKGNPEKNKVFTDPAPDEKIEEKDTPKKSSFPNPLDKLGKPAKIILEPTYGKHRPDEDAVFAFAEGYDLTIYVGFLESLFQTGYTGDVVLAVSSLNDLKNGVHKYLEGRNFGDMNVITYSVKWNCFDRRFQKVKGAREGMSLCQTVGFYGDAVDGLPLDDPTPPRPVATARYDLYWAWSLQYSNHSWIMLIDSRDTYFQTNPFSSLPRQKDNGSGNDESGLLYIFGENKEARNLKTSSYNYNWLLHAYGRNAIQSFEKETIACSGSSMGEKIAIETYLRAMILQYDKTKCNDKGCDQGFHNYLYYTKQLENAIGIKDIVFFEQGHGIINNLGALRDKPLEEQGLFDANLNKVLNWDKSISAVAHQFDRDPMLNRYVTGERRVFQKKWKESPEFAQSKLS